MTSLDASVQRLSGPGELAAALPLLCGFVPHESLVVVCLEGGRIGLTLRVDLPLPQDEDAAVAEVAARVRHSGAHQAYLLVVSEEPALPRRGLVEALRREVDAVDALLVRDGRWWSYLCADPGCCPTGGTPIPVSSVRLRRLRAEAVLAGRAVLPSREDLVASLSPPRPAGPAREVLRRAAERVHAERTVKGAAAVRARLLGQLRAALLVDPDDDPAAELALALDDVQVRDEVLTCGRSEEDALLALLLRLARRTPPPYDAAVCASLAWVAYGRGDGATASVALDRALSTDPAHGLALLLAQALDAQVPPRQLRAVAARAAVGLRRRRRR